MMRIDRDLRVTTSWQRGSAADSPGPFLISYAEFTPHHGADVVRIYLAARRLMNQCAELEGSVGLLTYWRLDQWKGGSLSVWESPEALRRFIGLAFHVEIMHKYRVRGTVRSTEWWSPTFDRVQGLHEGQRALSHA